MSANTQPNVIWISLESVRADHTTLGGYDWNTTPNLRRIADDADGQYFENCFSHARWTPAASTSILTGTYLTSHGVGLADTRDVHQVPSELRTVPELLADEGYQSGCFSSNPYISPATGLDRGFDRYHGPTERTDLLSTAGARAAAHYARIFRTLGAGFDRDAKWHKDCIYPLYQTEVLKEWLDDFAESDRPFFLYTHMNSIHHPYDPPLKLLERFADRLEMSPKEAYSTAKDLTDNIWDVIAGGYDVSPAEQEALYAVYDAEIAYADLMVGHLFDYARDLGLDASNTIFVVTGDHGELFGEQGVLGHNLVLHGGLTHVPLVTNGFGDLAAGSDDVVQHMDVTETLVGSAGGATDQFQGVDLRSERRAYALIQRGPRRRDLDSITEINPDFDVSQYHVGPVDCLRSRDWKFERSDGEENLFDLPDEDTDVSTDHPDVAERMAEALDRMLPDVRYGGDEDDQAEFSEDTKQRLADLGYL